MNSHIWDFNALTPPVLVDSHGVRLETFIINADTDLPNVELTGECYYENQNIQISVIPEDPAMAGTDSRSFQAVCKNQKFSQVVDAQGWSDTDYRIVLQVASKVGVTSKWEAPALKDIIPPVVSFTSVINAEVGSSVITSVPVAGHCEDDDGPVEILGEGVVLGTLTCAGGSFAGNVLASALTEGSQVFTVRQIDRAGNIGTAVSNSFNKDTIPPLLPIAFGPVGSALSNVDTSRTVTVTVPTDGIQYRYIVVKDVDCSGQWSALMAQTPQAGGTSATLSFSGDGIYRLCAIAGDQADNWQGAASIIESDIVEIDMTAPVLAITDPASGAKFQSGTTLAGSCEAGLTVTATGAFTPSPATATCSAVGDYSMVLTLSGADGNKTITVTSTDLAGNTTTLPAHTVVKDTTIIPPSVTLNTSTPTSDPVALFTVNDCSDHTMILVKEQNTPPTLGSSGWMPCSTAAQNYSYDFSVTDQQGLRNVRFYARDEAGNISTATVLTVNYDSKAPILSLDPVPTLAIGVAYPFVVYVTEATVSASAVLTLQYSVDGTTWLAATTRTLGIAGPMNNKPFTVSWAPPSFQVGMQVRALLTDGSGLTGEGRSNTFDVLSDITPPVLLDGEMKINGSLNPPLTVRSYVTVSLKAHDGETAITDFCLKTSNSVPSASDACWVSVKAPQPGLAELPDLVLEDFDFFMGINYGGYNIYAWVRDVAGNISVNSATLRKDYNAIVYMNDDPPAVSNFLTVNTTSPNMPPINEDMNFANGGAVYVSWTATDNGTIDKVELYSSTDGLTYAPIMTTLQNNSSNGTGCTYSAPRTGCWIWNSTFQNNVFFKLQLRVTDNFGQTSQVTSPPLNSQNLNLLAGNQDPGHNGNAKKTVFNTAVVTNTVPGTLLVTTDGKVFFNDSSFGLMYIDPKTNNSKILLRLAKKGESSVGDGVPVEQATAQAILRTTLDYQNRVLIYDRYMIRRIDTTVDPMTIETLIGADPAGNLGTSTADTVADPRDLKIDLVVNSTTNEPGFISSYAPFVVLPNGDLYFVSDHPGRGQSNGGRIRVYKGSLSVPRVETIRFSGTGVKNLPSWNLNTEAYRFFSLRYDPQSSAILKAYVAAAVDVPGNTYGNMTELNPTTWVANGVWPDDPYGPGETSLTYFDVQSLDGRVYRSNRLTSNSLVRLEDNGTWTRVLGTGDVGECADGTPATSCPVSLDDAFVDRYGRIYFSTRGIIKTVFNGNVYTLFGQRKDAGDGGSAFDMRMASIFYIDHGRSSGDVVLLDHQENKMREVRPAASPEVSLVAGTGEHASVNFGVPAALQPIPLGTWTSLATFATNPVNGDIYFNCSQLPYGSICRLNRATGYWEQILNGAGTVPSWQQGSIAIGDLQFTGYNPDVVAYSGGPLINMFYWSGTALVNSHLRSVQGGMSYYIGGIVGVDSDSDSCPDGPVTNCNLGQAGVHYGAAPSYFGPLSGWLVNPMRMSGPYSYSGSMHVLYSGVTRRLLTLPTPIQSYVYDSGSIYYCTDKGKLFEAHIHNASDLTSTANWPLVEGMDYTITELTMPTENIFCDGKRILIKSALAPKPRRLVMMAKQNGLPAIIEYFLP